MAFLPTLKELTSWVNKNVIPAITGLVDIFVKGEEPLGDWDAWWEKLRDAGGSEFADTVIGVTESVQDLLGVFSQFQSDISDRGVVDALADFATNLLIVGGVSEDQAVIIGEAIAEITDFIINAWNNDIHPALIEFKNWFDTDGRVALQNFYDKMQELSPYADQWLTLISDIRSALTDTKTAVDGLDLSFDLLGKRFSLVTETMNNFKQMADNAFATINQTQNAVAAAMRGDWLGAIDAISAAAVYAWKNSPIGQIAMLPGNIGRGIGEMIGNNLQGRANGGDVMANQPYIVGERGAEMFVPKQSGTIVPNGARGGVNININAPVYGVADLQAAIMGALNRYDRGLA